VGFDDKFRFRDCPRCGLRDAEMRVLNRDQQATALDGRVRWFSLIYCPRCANVVVLETNGEKQSPGVVLATVPESPAEVGVSHLPADVAGYYRDAIRVLDVGVADAAAVQLRRTLEAAASHHGVGSGSLIQRIDKLIKAGLITQPFAGVLDHIRQVGNVGAHATDERLDEATVRRALRFTTQVLRNLFEIPRELELIEGVEREESEAWKEPGGERC
jgi:hypothetical protein